MKTTDGGTTWTQNSQWASLCGSLPNVHADIHNIFYLPTSTSQLVVVSDGGIYYTSDGGTTYTNKSAGYRTIQYYSAAIDPASGSNYMLGGAQDNGTHKFTAAGLGSVSTVTGGDGGFCFIDQNNSTYQISSYVYADYFISRNGGTSFSTNADFSGTSPNNNGRFINPTDYDNTQKIIYASYSDANLARITNITSGAPAVATINFSSAGTMRVSAIKVDPNTANRVWVAFSNNGTATVPQIYYVDNANASASIVQVTTPAALTSSSYISSIDIDPADATHIIMTVSNYGVASVWESTNLGASWTSLDNNGVNLPDVPVRWAIFLPSGYNFTGRMSAVGGIMLATELGVWTTTSSNGTSTTWTQSSGLPNVRVDMLVLRNSDKTIVAATHGRGLFTTQLQAILPVTLLTFDGVLENNAVILNWNTSREQDTHYFDIEKSTDGISYIKIGSVNAAGNSTTTINYSFIDNKINPINYYRLRINDFDGSSHFSKVITIRNNNATQNVWLINNPFNNYIEMSFAKGGAVSKLQLFNSLGAVVAEKTITSQSGRVRWDLPQNLSSGGYVFKVIVDDRMFTFKVVKQ
jgi:hypothetical protein